jgi:hypothetical protein
MELNVAQAVITTVAIFLLTTPLLIMSYVAGRQSKTQGRSQQLEQLQPDAILAGSTWRVEYDGDADTEAVQSILLELKQSGCRIVANGHSAHGNHSLEGVIHRSRLCCVSIDENRDGVWLGTVTAELHADNQQMTGMRTRWSPQSQTLMVRKATFTRLHADASGA